MIPLPLWFAYKYWISYYIYRKHSRQSTQLCLWPCVRQQPTEIYSTAVPRVAGNHRSVCGQKGLTVCSGPLAFSLKEFTPNRVVWLSVLALHSLHFLSKKSEIVRGSPWFLGPTALLKFSIIKCPRSLKFFLVPIKYITVSHLNTR